MVRILRYLVCLKYNLILYEVMIYFSTISARLWQTSTIFPLEHQEDEWLVTQGRSVRSGDYVWIYFLLDYRHYLNQCEIRSQCEHYFRSSNQQGFSRILGSWNYFYIRQKLGCFSLSILPPATIDLKFDKKITEPKHEQHNLKIRYN